MSDEPTEEDMLQELSQQQEDEVYDEASWELYMDKEIDEMNNQEITKYVAEAVMGLQCTGKDKSGNYCFMTKPSRIGLGISSTSVYFNPFVNANDDVMVQDSCMEHFSDEDWKAYCRELSLLKYFSVKHGDRWGYKIGFYAQAAYSVVKEREGEDES